MGEPSPLRYESAKATIVSAQERRPVSTRAGKEVTLGGRGHTGATKTTVTATARASGHPHQQPPEREEATQHARGHGCEALRTVASPANRGLIRVCGTKLRRQTAAPRREGVSNQPSWELHRSRRSNRSNSFTRCIGRIAVLSASPDRPAPSTKPAKRPRPTR